MDELAVALDPELELLAGRALDDVFHRVGVRERLAVDGDDGVPGLEAGDLRRGLRGRPLLERLDRVVVRQMAEAEDEDQRQDEGDDQVHDRPGGGHEDPLAERLVAVRPGLVLFGHLFHGREPDDADVAAGGDRLDAVLGLALADRPQPGPEAHEELGGLHARPLGRGEVPQLVEHHDHDQDGDEEEQVAPAEQDEHGGDEGEDPQQLEQASRVALGRRRGVRRQCVLRRRRGRRVLHGEGHRCPQRYRPPQTASRRARISRARRRASASAANTPSTWST